MENKVKFQAHRGLSSLYPENTLVSYQGAIDKGYKIIEMDPKLTKDGKFVLLHDETINRTARTKKGEKISGQVYPYELTLEELKKLDFGIWKDNKFSGEKIPTLQDALTLLEKNHGIVFKFDNFYEKFSDEEIDRFLKEIGESNQLSKIAIACTTIESVERAVTYLPNVEIHFDGAVDRETLVHVKKAAKNHPLSFWISYPNEYTSWCKRPKASKELCALIKEYGELAIWTLSTVEEYLDVTDNFHADAIETNGELSPDKVDEYKKIE